MRKRIVINFLSNTIRLSLSLLHQQNATPLRGGIFVLPGDHQVFVFRQTGRSVVYRADLYQAGHMPRCQDVDFRGCLWYNELANKKIDGVQYA